MATCITHCLCHAVWSLLNQVYTIDPQQLSTYRSKPCFSTAFSSTWHDKYVWPLAFYWVFRFANYACSYSWFCVEYRHFPETGSSFWPQDSHCDCREAFLYNQFDAILSEQCIECFDMLDALYSERFYFHYSKSKLLILYFSYVWAITVWLAFRCYILTDNWKEICAEIKCMLRSFSGHLWCKRLPLGIERPHWPFDVGLDSVEKRRLCALPSMQCISFCAIFSYKKLNGCVYCRCFTDLDWIHIVIYMQ